MTHKGGNSATYRISVLKRDQAARSTLIRRPSQSSNCNKCDNCSHHEADRDTGQDRDNHELSRPQADPESGEYVNPNGGGSNNPHGRKGKPKEEITGGSTATDSSSASAERNTKAQILRRLARERPDSPDYIDPAGGNPTGANQYGGTRGNTMSSSVSNDQNSNSGILRRRQRVGRKTKRQICRMVYRHNVNELKPLTMFKALAIAEPVA